MIRAYVRSSCASSLAMMLENTVGAAAADAAGAAADAEAAADADADADAALA